MPIIKHARVGDIMESLIPDGLWDIPNEETMELVVTSTQYSATEEQVNALIEVEIAKEEAVLYREERKYQYPDIRDQLDDLFHQGAFSSKMADKIQAVKDAFPKP